jgi:hypothetical protein
MGSVGRAGVAQQVVGDLCASEAGYPFDASAGNVIRTALVARYTPPAAAFAEQRSVETELLFGLEIDLALPS